MSIAFRKAVEKDPNLDPKNFVAYSDEYDVSKGAKQEFKEECNVNFILKNLKRTGVIEHLDPSKWQTGVLENLSLQEAMQINMEAGELFQQLPASVRREFDHSPLKFVEEIGKPEYKTLLDKNGLLAVKDIEKVMKVEVINPQTANIDDSTTK